MEKQTVKKVGDNFDLCLRITVRKLFLRSHTMQNVISVFSYNTLSLVISVEMRKFVYFFGLHNSGNHPFLASQRALTPLPPPAA